MTESVGVTLALVVELLVLSEEALPEGDLDALGLLLAVPQGVEVTLMDVLEEKVRWGELEAEAEGDLVGERVAEAQLEAEGDTVDVRDTVLQGEAVPLRLPLELALGQWLGVVLTVPVLDAELQALELRDTVGEEEAVLHAVRVTRLLGVTLPVVLMDWDPEAV